MQIGQICVGPKFTSNELSHSMMLLATDLTLYGKVLECTWRNLEPSRDYGELFTALIPPANVHHCYTRYLCYSQMYTLPGIFFPIQIIHSPFL